MPHDCTETFRVTIEVEGGPASSFNCFPFATEDGATSGIFISILILSSPAPKEVTTVATLDTEATEVATAFGRTAVPCTVVVFGATLE
jgi:hypothetical protein